MLFRSPVRYSSRSSEVCTVSADTGQVSALALGDCVIAADQAGDAHYAPAASATQTLPVLGGHTQTLQFAALPGLNLYGAATVQASASSGLPVRYESATPTVCSVQAATGFVVDLAAGDCTVVARQAGNAQYDPAPALTQTLSVAGAAGAPGLPGAPDGVSATLSADEIGRAHV